MDHRELIAQSKRLLGELTISELVYRSRAYLRFGFWVLVALLLAGALSALVQGGVAYLGAYLLITTGLLPPIIFWIFSLRKNIPLVPSLAFVNLVWNALPLAFGNSMLNAYSDSEIIRAAGEILVFGVALSTAYLVVSSSPSTRPREYLGFAITELRSRRVVLGASLVALTGCVCIEFLMLTGLIGQYIAWLPPGGFSVIRVIQEASKMASALVLGYAIGGRYITGIKQIYVIFAWCSLFTMALASLLLSSAAGMAIAIAAGLYLGSGRIPWKYILAMLAVVSFFNYSKAEMRKKHWGRGIGTLQLHELPEYFQEWSLLTVEKLFGDAITTRKDKTQGLLERVSTLQMLLYVQRMVQSHQYSTLNGATYEMIPQLLVPRILWPDKPRTHQGQVLLNTHFGRQRESETWRTYIAWGLIAESYGNFGSMLGPLALGLFLGAFLSGIEVWSGNFPLLSLRGAIAAAILLETLISYEMSAAVLVTSSAQLIIIIAMAAVPLAGRHRLVRTA
jgi:hypothetical protein